MNLDMIPEVIPSKKPLSAETLFESMAVYQIPDLLDELLINYMKSGAPPLPKTILENYTFTNLAKFNALRASIKYRRTEDFKLLINNDASIVVSKSKKITILHYLARKCSYAFLELFFTNFKEIAKCLINEVGLDKKPEKSSLITDVPPVETPLCYAIRSKSNKTLECIQLLLEQNASVNTVCSMNALNKSIDTPFTIALQTTRSLPVLKLLQGATLDLSFLSETQIITSLAKNFMIDDETRSHFIEVLAQEHVNLDAVDQLNRPLVYYAHKWKLDLSLKTLISFNASISPLEEFFEKTNSAIKEKIIRIAHIAKCIEHLTIKDKYPLKTTLEYAENIYEDDFCFHLS